MASKLCIPVFFALFGLLLFSGLSSAVSVIVINDTEEKVYALESLILSGDLQSGQLSMAGSGEVLSGKGVRVYLLGPSSDVLVKELTVDGVAKSVSFDERGYYFLQEKGRFDLSGTLDIRTLGQLNLKVPGPLNELIFILQHGYAIGGDRFGLLDDTIVIQRVEKVAMLVEGAFRFTYAEKDSFRYVLDLKAFGSDIGRYELPLLNGETVTDVTGALKWEQSGGRLILDLSGSEKTVAISGLFDAAELNVPLAEDKHHVVIEADAEKKLTISTAAKEIDLTESSIPATYPNARAFLAGRGEAFRVSVQELGLLPSLAAAVRSANNVVAVTEKGSIVGEMSYDYANTGVDYIEVESPGDPLYASTASGPVKLTKDEKLLLSFPKNDYGRFDFVYFTTRGTMQPVDLIKVPLAKTDLPVTTAHTSIYLPQDYYVLETFGAPGGSELPDLQSAALFVILTGGLAYLLNRRAGFVLSSVIFAGGLFAFSEPLFCLVVAAAIVYKVKDHFKGLNWKPVLAVVGGLAILLLVLVGFGGLLTLRSVNAASSVQYGAGRMVMEEAAAPMMKGMATLGRDEAGAISVPTRTGVLPVKLEIPNLGKMISVTNHLVTKENPLELQVLLVSRYFIWLFYLLAAYCGVRSYGSIKGAAEAAAAGMKHR